MVVSTQMIAQFLRRYSSRRMLMIFLLGFSSGLPIVLIIGTLQARLQSVGTSIATIGFFSLLQQPYTLKFLWAPIMDLYSPNFLDRRRSWIITMQLLLIAIIAGLAFCDMQTSPSLFITLGLMLAICSATQDIAFDAYKIDVLEPDERGLGTAIGIEGYRLGMITAGGFALMLADHVSWRVVYLTMAALMSIGVVATLCAEKLPPMLKDPNAVSAWTIIQKNISENLYDFFEKYDFKPLLLLMLVLVFYKLGEAFSMSLTTPFLLDTGFTLTEVGTISKVLGVVCSLLGIFVGGVIMTRWSLYRALLFFGFLQAVTNIGYWVIAITAKNYFLTASIIAVENICGGMGTTALTVFMMSICNKKYSASQFALLSVLASLGRIYAGMMSGLLVERLDWALFYLVTIGFAMPGIILLMLAKPIIMKIDKDKKSQTFIGPETPKGMATA